MAILSSTYLRQHQAAINLLKQNTTLATQIFDGMCEQLNINSNAEDAMEQLSETVEKRTNHISTAGTVVAAISTTLQKNLGETALSLLGEQQRVSDLLLEGDQKLAAISKQLDTMGKGLKDLRASFADFEKTLPPQQPLAQRSSITTRSVTIITPPEKT